MAVADRISQLPESILHHILSFLSQKQAFQTSALSKPWRHVGPTRPKLEFRESCFKPDRETFMSILDDTVQRYRRQKLFVQEFVLDMSSAELVPEQISVVEKLIPMVLINIKAVTKIELVFSKQRPMYIALPSLIFQAQLLTELCLKGCNFVTCTGDGDDDDHKLILIKRLKTLSLDHVTIGEEILEKIMRSCPLIERLLLSDCAGMKNIACDMPHMLDINNPPPFFDNVDWARNCRAMSRPCLVVNSPKWDGHEKYYFPRLKSLYLGGVKLTDESFCIFSSDFRFLEELELNRCHGFQEIQLTACSIKRLVISINSTMWIRLKVTIYAPNIHYFEFSGHIPPQLVFYTETAREWTSRVVMLFDISLDKNALRWHLQLTELLDALRESRICLDVNADTLKNLKLEDTHDVGFLEPVAVEQVRLNGDYRRSCSFPDLLNCLFLICRPRYIHMGGDIAYEIAECRTKNKLVEFIIFKIIPNQGEMSRCYLWERDLEEISMQVWDENINKWHPVQEITSLPKFTTSNPNIRFSLQWRD